MTSWKAILFLLSVNVVLMGASYTMVMPFLPIYLSELGATETSLKLWSGAVYGITFAVCALMSPVWGRLSDRFGKKAMFIRAGVLMSVTYLLTSLVATPLQFFLVRALQGFSAGMWPATLAMVSASAPRDRIGVSMGIIQSSHIFGAVVGPLLGGVLAEWLGIRFSYRLGFAFYLLVTLASAILLKEPAPAGKAAAPRAVAGSSFRQILSCRPLLLLLCLNGVSTLVMMMLQPILTLYIGQLRGTTENLMSISGLIFSLIGLAGVLSSPLWGRWGQKHGFALAMGLSFISGGILMAMQCLPSTVLMLAVLQFTSGLCLAGVLPSSNSLLTQLTSSQSRGATFGLVFAFQQGGGAFGPLLGSAVAAFTGFALVFMLAGLIQVAAGGVILHSRALRQLHRR